MNATLGRVLSQLARGPSTGGENLDGFVDSLLQAFENCRSGLTEEQLRGGEAAVRAFFLELYEKEVPRLQETIRLKESLLSEAARGELFRRVDALVRDVVLPAYVRLAVRFTPRERNDFYVLPEGLHGLERLLWVGAGIALGAFIVWAPFIPLWEKEWVLPFAFGGLFTPDLRRYLALRRYNRDLNRLVRAADQEIARLDAAYLTESSALSERRDEPLESAKHAAESRILKEGSS